MRLPATASPSMSRRLFTTSSATDSRPTGTATAKASAGKVRVWAKVVPTTATSPKNTKTNTSPSAR